MIQCFGVDDEKIKTRNNKKQNLKKLIIVEDNNNLVIVEPSSQENSAKILINNPWKHIITQINRDEGNKLIIKISHCLGGNARI